MRGKESKGDKKQRWANRLRALRVLSGYSQERLCDVAGIPFGTYVGWENGRIPRTASGTDDLYSTLDITSACLLTPRPLPGNRFWLLYPGGITTDRAKNDEAITDQLSSMLPQYYNNNKYDLADGAIFVITNNDQYFCIVVPDDYLPTMEPLLINPINKSTSPLSSKSVAELSGADIANLELPTAVTMQFKQRLIELRYSDFPTQYFPWHLGYAMQIAKLTEDKAREVAQKYLELSFKDNYNQPDNPLYEEMVEIIMHYFKAP